ncbi:MAG: hypothetical protein FWC41_05880 [Firmicutes bacterium]|nr:hypothetical protein [Bacillota bacterium]
MPLRLNFYSRIIKDINKFHSENEYVDITSQLIFYNEIRKEAVLLFKKFNFSQEALNKIEEEVIKELSQKYPTETVDELNEIEDLLQRDLEKRKRIENGEMIKKPFDISTVPIEEVSNTRKIKIQQYATQNKGDYEIVDIYLKYFEEDGITISEVITQDILSEIVLMEI